MLVQQQCALIWHKFVTLAKFKQNFGHSFKLLNKNFAPLDDRPISTTQSLFIHNFLNITTLDLKLIMILRPFWATLEAISRDNTIASNTSIFPKIHLHRFV